MHTLDELTVRLLSELIEIAEGLGLKNAKKESKIYLEFRTDKDPLIKQGKKMLSKSFT